MPTARPYGLLMIDKNIGSAIRKHVQDFWPNSVISEEVWGEGQSRRAHPDSVS